MEAIMMYIVLGTVLAAVVWIALNRVTARSQEPVLQPIRIRSEQKRRR